MVFWHMSNVTFTFFVRIFRASEVADSRRSRFLIGGICLPGPPYTILRRNLMTAWTKETIIRQAVSAYFFIVVASPILTCISNVYRLKVYHSITTSYITVAGGTSVFLQLSFNCLQSTFHMFHSVPYNWQLGCRAVRSAATSWLVGRGGPWLRVENFCVFHAWPWILPTKTPSHPPSPFNASNRKENESYSHFNLFLRKKGSCFYVCFN